MLLIFKFNVRWRHHDNYDRSKVGSQLMKYEVSPVKPNQVVLVSKPNKVVLEPKHNQVVLVP